jgi:hypothetical protein
MIPFSEFFFFLRKESMPKKIILIILSFVFSQSLLAKIAEDEHILDLVDKRTELLEKKFNEPRLLVSPQSFTWPELNNFRQEIMFIAAHDPAGIISKNIPFDLHPSGLTLRFEKSFETLKSSASQVISLTESESWKRLEEEVKTFISNRNQHLYGPARSIIRSGSFVKNLDEVERLAAKTITNEQTKLNISVRVLDPYFLTLGTELKDMNQSIKKLKEFRNPPVPKMESIFQVKHLKELSLLTFITLIFSLGAVAVVHFYKTRKLRKKISAPAKIDHNGFDYYDWLRRLETNLKAVKAYEDSYTESHFSLKEHARNLANARKGLNLAERQEDFYTNLEMVNHIASKIEEYFENLEVKKNTETSRRTVKLVIQLCEAVENKQKISLNGTVQRRAQQTQSLERANLEVA